MTEAIKLLKQRIDALEEDTAAQIEVYRKLTTQVIDLGIAISELRAQVTGEATPGDAAPTAPR